MFCAPSRFSSVKLSRVPQDFQKANSSESCTSARMPAERTANGRTAEKPLRRPEITGNWSVFDERRTGRLHCFVKNWLAPETLVRRDKFSLATRFCLKSSQPLITLSRRDAASRHSSLTILYSEVQHLRILGDPFLPFDGPSFRFPGPPDSSSGVQPMDLNRLILPTDSNLVLKQPGLSESLDRLFQHLETSSEARLAFLENPEALLEGQLGIDLGASAGTSIANRVFHRLLTTQTETLPAANEGSVSARLALLRPPVCRRGDPAPQCGPIPG